MKKLLLVLTSLAIAITANAQFASSGSQRTSNQPTQTKRFVSYVKAGVSFNSFSFDKSLLDLAKQEGANLSIGSTVGYNALYGFQYSLIENLGLYLGAEIGVGTRGFKTTMSESGSAGSMIVSYSLLNHNAKITPVQIGYKHYFTRLFAVDVHIGGFVSYDFAGKGKFGGLDNGNVYEQSVDIKDIDGFQRFDAGINPGITLWVGPVGLDFTYQRGFVNAQTSVQAGDMSKAYSSNFLLGLAFCF